MKNNFYIIGILLPVMVFYTLSLQAVNRDSLMLIKKYHTARTTILKTIDPEARETALAAIMQCAENGALEAMNFLGVYYLKGIGTPIDMTQSIYWLKKAAQKKYFPAMNNLSRIYYLGIGEPQDYATAYALAHEGAIAGCTYLQYLTGYLQYKGLGCEQNYTEAVKWFRQSAAGNFSGAMYMLGLCYRNGFGVERNSVESNLWLSKAAKGGHKHSRAELLEEQPENPITPIVLRSAVLSGQRADRGYLRVAHRLTAPLSGEYRGTLLTYDWSGKNVLRERHLRLTLQQDGDVVSGMWTEEGQPTLQITGHLTPESLTFTQGCFARTDRYSQGDTLHYTFRQATLNTASRGDTLQITGNLQLYSVDDREPEKPIFISLQRINETKPETKSLQWVVYPNPVIDHMCLSVQLPTEDEAHISIAAADGAVVYREQLGRLTAGKHMFTLHFDAAPGEYVVTLYAGERQSSLTLIKK